MVFAFLLEFDLAGPKAQSGGFWPNDAGSPRAAAGSPHTDARIDAILGLRACPHLTHSFNKQRANSGAPFRRAEPTIRTLPRRGVSKPLCAANARILLHHAIMSHEDENPLLVYLAAAIRTR
jgi:hypothetical protein